MCFSEQKSQYLWPKNVRHAAPPFLKKGEKERKCKNGNAACPIWGRRLVFGMGPFGALGHAQRSELVAALVLPVHCQLAISGRSTPCAAMYCRCSTSLSRICCTV